MNVIEQIKELISPCSSESARNWAKRWFIGSRQSAASSVVQQILALRGGELDRLTDESLLIDDLALNELQRVQLVLGLEQQFKITIGNRDADGIQTIGQLVECVYSKTQNVQPPNVIKER